MSRGGKMSVFDYLKPVKTLNAGEVRRFLDSCNPGDYNLIDVRQPREYERSHLPGAMLIPVGELQDHLQELDRNKPTITY